MTVSWRSPVSWLLGVGTGICFYICLFLYISPHEYVHTCTCWMLDVDGGVILSSAMNRGKFSSQPLGSAFLYSFLNLLVPSVCLLDHPRPLGTGTKQHLPLDQRVLLGSCPQPLHLLKYVVFCVCCLLCFLSQVFRNCLVGHLFAYYANASVFHRGFPGHHSKECRWQPF